MYVTVDFICIGSFELCVKRRKWELQKEKSLPTAGFEPSIFRLLDRRSNGQSYQGFNCSHLKVNDIHILYYVIKHVQSKTRNKINFNFHFIIYRDLNVKVFSKCFPFQNFPYWNWLKL